MARPQMHRQAADRFAVCEGSQYRSDFGCPTTATIGINTEQNAADRSHEKADAEGCGGQQQ
jgi:hypothetical protein